MALRKIGTTEFDVDTITTVRHNLNSLKEQKSRLQEEVIDVQMAIERLRVGIDQLRKEIDKINVLIAEAKAEGVQEDK